MPVTTLSAAVHITPVVLKTFLAHTKRKAQKFKSGIEEEDAKDDVFFDEAFHIVKAFIELGTKNTVESLQAFTNTHVPAPYWAAVVPVRIPLSSCNRAADLMIDWFGPEELEKVVGGERWWQVRGLDGIDAEWITEKEYLHNDGLPDRRLPAEEQMILRMEKLDTVMFYIHGGGYFWGSINTHRYQIIRFARKIRGRAFTVNYRKAPQYPWPCPLVDVIAAYLYLIQPPENASHKPIPPSKIVFAGDSAGGGLALTCLTVLRDLGLPMPAGAVLISPWVDLTHSFPSVMKNTETDIIPQYGFLAKPSTLWPIDPIPPPDGRIRQTQTNPPPKPGHADTLRPDNLRLTHQSNESSSLVQNQQEMLEKPSPGPDHQHEKDHPDEWEPKPPKVLMEDSTSIPLELCSQIQLYATNEQLTHPLVSPILQGSLCNLPPLYILAGEGEALRDEIVYLAHRAAHPRDYPVRHGALEGRRQKFNAENFVKPTKVKLQVFDGMCHVLTVFTFTESAKYAYRSIATFVRHVTGATENAISPPSPELVRPRDVGDHLKIGETDSDGSEQSNVNICKQEVKVVAELANEEVEDVVMIRERVDIHGHVRQMEPRDQIQTLSIPPEQVGLIKEAPAKRWLKGQQEWDKIYRRAARRAVKKRKKLEVKAQRTIDNARQQGLILTEETILGPVTSRGQNSEGIIQIDRRWGPLDLGEENPPSSAIAKRRDTTEALALLKKSIYHTAPVTHRTVPKLKMSDAIRAAFDPDDDPIRPPQQSASEQQVKMSIPIHGLNIWDGLIRYFMRESTRKAAEHTNPATKQVHSIIS